jgi:alpha-tubulin suppressor-like RCC1 family protein
MPTSDCTPSRSTFVLAAALLLTSAGCREEATSPTSPDSNSTFAAAATAPLSFRQVSTRNGASCGTTTDDLAYCWGFNISGQLGDGTTTNRNRPVAVLGGLRFRYVSPGFTHSCGLTTTNQVYCWGRNTEGQFGNGSTNNTPSLPVLAAGGRRFRQLSAGLEYTCAVTATDRAFCWGDNFVGSLGDGSTSERRLTPVRVAGNLLFKMVETGGSHTCGVTTGNVAYCWGNNSNGQLGDRTKINRRAPVPVSGGLRFRQIGASLSSSCGVTTGSRAYCWGNNFFRQLGDGSDYPRRLRPVPVTGGLEFATVSAGGTHTCGIATTGKAYCWGLNWSPEPVAVAGSHSFKDLRTDGEHTCGVTPGDKAYCWGENSSGQLGNGTNTDSQTPVAVVGPM